MPQVYKRFLAQLVNTERFSHGIATCLFKMAILIELVLAINKEKTKHEFGNDLSICVLNVLPKVTTLPTLVVIGLAKVDIVFVT